MYRILGLSRQYALCIFPLLVVCGPSRGEAYLEKQNVLLTSIYTKPIVVSRLSSAPTLGYSRIDVSLSADQGLDVALDGTWGHLSWGRERPKNARRIAPRHHF